MPLDPGTAALLSAGASSAGGLFGSIISNRGALKRQKLANKQNIEFWKMQNEYNHPSQQMARLREAGLNANMIYGTSPTSAVGNAGAIAPAKAAPYEMKNPLERIGDYFTFKRQEVETNNAKKYGNVIIMDALKRAAEIGNITKDTELKGTINEKTLQELENVRLESELRKGTLANKIKQSAAELAYAQAHADREKEEQIRAQVMREWADYGLTPNDNVFLRMMVRGVKEFGGNVSDFFKEAYRTYSNMSNEEREMLGKQAVKSAIRFGW